MTAAVDMHVHLAPVLPGWPNEQGKHVIDGHAVGPAALYRPDELLEHVHGHGLDKALVSPPPPFFRQELGASDAETWVTQLNDGFLTAVAGHPELLPLAYLPLEHPELAIVEHGRRASDHRWAGFCASAGGRSVSMAEPALSRLWDALDEAGALMFLHPGISPDERLQEFYLHNLVGNPVETAIAAAQLVFGDVLPRHARLRILLLHGGGCVLDLVSRWDHGLATRRPGVRPLTEIPSVAVRRMYVDCLLHDRTGVDRAIEVFGADRMVLGSDWPFPMGTDDPRALVRHRGEHFTETIARVNAASALGRSVS